MTVKRTKLELTWIGKDERPRLEPRILLEDSTLSHHARARAADGLFDNRLIFGDNLLALKALEREFSGRIKCVYIDPPFNTRQAFQHYDDGVEHSVWLTLMRDRLELLHRLLRTDGTMAVHIDDNELGYLIVLADEIFGRSNRAYLVTFKQSSSSGPKAVNPGLVTTTSYILIYAKDKAAWKPRKLYAPTKRDDRYNRFILNPSDDCGRWQLIGLRQALAIDDEIELSQLKERYPTKDELEGRLTTFVESNAGSVVRTARVAAGDIAQSARPAFEQSRVTLERVFRGTRDGNTDLFFLRGEQLLFYSSKLRDVDGNLSTVQAATTLWDDLLSNNLHKEGGVTFPNGKKPEALIKRVLEMATEQGDWVLDSFAGSGTTAAAAHKMRRNWIAVEVGSHCDLLIVPRLRAVIDGADTSGITKAVGWHGGGGFRYYRLAPSLLRRDRWSNWVINRDFNPEMLAEAVCKLENFSYAPSQEIWWQHGRSTERDFIYVTTQTLTQPQLAQISEEVGPDRTLLVCCGSFRANANAFPNLTVKKIPKAVMHRCEWGRDDYSLSIAALPEAAASVTETEDALLPSRRRRAARKGSGSPTLFALDAGDTSVDMEEP
jgi:adenine-specific DNA-methyltransferase